MNLKTESSGINPYREFLRPGSVKWPGRFVIFLYFLLAVGTIAFLFGIFSGYHQRAWQIYLVNFLFWSGLSISGVIISATLRIVGARWGVPFKRIAEGMTAFLPVSFLLFLILFAGRHDCIPWLQNPDPHRTPWLNLPLFFARNTVSLLILYGMSIYYVLLSLRPDISKAVREREAEAVGLRAWVLRGGNNEIDDAARRDRILRWFSVALVAFYSLAFSLLAFDLVMSLDRRFYSTLFGMYFFVGNLYIGFAALGTLIFLHIRHGNLGKLVNSSHLHDQGKLTFAFCMLTGYMLFVHFLVLWYGNLPEEIGFLLRRISDEPWRRVSPLMALLAVVLPLCILLSRSLKKKPAALLTMGLCILGGMWLERFVLVVPSLWQGRSLPLGWMELAITAGFLAATLLSYRAFTLTFPMVAVTDEHFLESNELGMRN